MFTFVDLSSYYWDSQPMFKSSPQPQFSPMGASASSPRIRPKEGFRAPSKPQPIDDYSCTSRECQACKLKIIQGFIHSSGNDSALQQMQQRMIQNIGPTSGGGQLHCDYLDRKVVDLFLSRILRIRIKLNPDVHDAHPMPPIVLRVLAMPRHKIIQLSTK